MKLNPAAIEFFAFIAFAAWLFVFQTKSRARDKRERGASAPGSDPAKASTPSERHETQGE